MLSIRKSSKLAQFILPSLLFLIELILFCCNYTPKTFFLGWDNLFPEMNFGLNIERSIFAIWQEYRGLGLLDGMSFAANLPHYLFLFVISFVLPDGLLRYFFIMLMHFLGGIGIFYFIKELLENKKNNQLLTFLGSLFYLFNLVTIQIFFASYEVFTVHFAFLPLLTLFSLKYLKSGQRSHLMWLGLLSIFALPQAHVPTLFIVYCFSQLIILSSFILFVKKDAVKRGFVIFSLVFAVNSFWGLPYIYSALSNAKTIANSKINQMSTADIFQKNKAYGDFKSVALLKGYSLDFIDAKADASKGLMMGVWKEHSEKPLFVLIGYTFFIFSLIGLGKIIIKKDKLLYPFVFLFIFSFLMLGTDIPILGRFYQLCVTYIPYFFQIFRFTFTKFAILYAFSFSILFTFGVATILSWLKAIEPLKTVLFYIVLFFMVVYSFPVWKGEFLYKNLRVVVLDDYFKMVLFFKKQPGNGRISLLPQSDFWGWTYNDWGYKGSGFIWYGLPQASMDGAFYPWSQENENYYWEISHAIYSRNLKEVENVLEKYQINWIILDENIIDVGDYKALFFRETEELFAQSGKIKPSQNFGSILVYQVNLETPVKDFVYLAQNLPQVNTYNWNNDDTAFADLGHYQSNFQFPISNFQTNFQSPSTNFQAYYPFRSLFTNRKQEELEFGVEDKGENFVFSSPLLNPSITNYSLLITPLNEIERVFWTKDLQELPFPTPFVSTIPTPGLSQSADRDERGSIEETVQVEVAKQKGYFSYDSDDDPNFFNQEPKSCDPFNTGKFTKDIIEEQGSKLIRFTSIGSSNCADISLPHFIQNQGYLVKIQHRHVTGKGLMFYVINQTSKNRVIETALPTNNVKARPLHQAVETSYFIISPQQPYGQGYSLHFDNISIGREQTINDLGRVEVYTIPYSFLKLLKFQSITTNTINASELITTNNFQVKHPNPSFYKITINNQQPALPAGRSVSNNLSLVLSQSYHQGWKAYLIKNSESRIQNYLAETFPFIFGSKIKEHVLINNWQNGWKLDQSTINNQQSTICLFFWPQLLEYLGFGFLFFGTVILIKKGK